VIEALVLRGIARERLEPVGFGDERPGEPRKTAAARARNRRVEFTLRSCWLTSDPNKPIQAHECR
jgi:outer membrane protein OmpA-like peptidoglycan-associated protein